MLFENCQIDNSLTYEKFVKLTKHDIICDIVSIDQFMSYVQLMILLHVESCDEFTNLLNGNDGLFSATAFSKPLK